MIRALFWLLTLALLVLSLSCLFFPETIEGHGWFMRCLVLQAVGAFVYIIIARAHFKIAYLQL